MAIKRGFQVDSRVGIAVDAMSASQKAALEQVLQDKEHFVAHAKRPGVTRKLSDSRPLYMMRAGGGMRIIFTIRGENIAVLDVMRKVTADQFVPKKKTKGSSTKKDTGKASVKRGEPIKAREV
jgi:hypothetical protein